MRDDARAGLDRLIVGPPKLLGHPNRQGARVSGAGRTGETFANFPTLEEVYYFTSGRGRMHMDDAVAEVRPGDCVRIPPGAARKLWAGRHVLPVLLCACAPPCSDEGTTMLGGSRGRGLYEAMKPE